MKNKLTAVDYIVNVVNSCIAPDYIPNEIVNQAKKMEKEQIKDALYFMEKEQIKDALYFIEAREFYNEMYGKE